METEFTLGELVSIKDSLSKLYNYDIPMDEAQPAGRTLADIEKELEIYESNRKKLFEKYGNLESEQLVIPPEKIAEFNAELQTLLSCKVTIDIATIKSSSLEGIKLSVVDMRGLNRFIETVKPDDLAIQDISEPENPEV